MIDVDLADMIAAEAPKPEAVDYEMIGGVLVAKPKVEHVPTAPAPAPEPEGKGAAPRPSERGHRG